ncbi:MAG: hypothetical protein K0R25_1187 [Rickettsiaceae bacterium]|jgi:hypothetical protein|nr:hypothetical protein [Rickettsiaceae bacterium]
MKFVILIITFISLSSCKARFQSPADDFKEDLATASPDFQQGWKDGCDVGMASGSNSFYQMYHKTNRVDGYKMSYSPDYQTAWNNAWWYCYRSDWTDQRSTMWGSVFGGYR